LDPVSQELKSGVAKRRREGHRSIIKRCEVFLETCGQFAQ